VAGRGVAAPGRIPRSHTPRRNWKAGSKRGVGVPDHVRATLIREQEKAFDELHGEKFTYK
jgi:hypothetical protein